MKTPKGVPYQKLLEQLIGSTIIRVEEPLDIYETIKNKPLRSSIRSIIGKTCNSDTEILVDGIARFLQGPVIVDRFLHHSERRRYANSLSEIPELAIVYRAYQCNILRRNLIVSAVTIADMFIDDIAIDPDIRIITVSSGNITPAGMTVSRYDELSVDQKIATVRSIQKAIYSAIEKQL